MLFIYEFASLMMIETSTKITRKFYIEEMQSFNAQKITFEDLIKQVNLYKKEPNEELLHNIHEACVVFIVRRLKKKKRGDTEKAKQLLDSVSLGSKNCLFDNSQQLKLAKLAEKHFNIEVQVQKASQQKNETESDEEDNEEEESDHKDVAKWLSDETETVDIQSGSLAQKADKYVLYQQCVQSAKQDIYLFEKIYKEHYSHQQPTVFREDFCGTGWLSTEWVKRNRIENIAVGIDIDREPIEWGLKNNIASLNSASESVFLFTADVLKFNWDTEISKMAKKYPHLQNSDDEENENSYKLAHIVCAYNYSTCLLHERSQISQFFSNVRKSMSPSNSMFLLDVLGGKKFSSVQERTKKTPTNQYTYLFEQESYNPVTDIAQFNIHFKFNQDNSVLRKAFSFQFRKWGVRELVEVLKEVGFSQVIIYWSNHDNDEIAFKRLSVEEQSKFQQSDHWTALLCALY
jgi:hypothetical protein